MAISYIGAASAASASLSMPTHQAGDLLIACIYRDNSATLPSRVSGWSAIGTSGASGNAIFIATKTAQSSVETFGTWTNATHVICAVYRSTIGKMLEVNNFASGGGTAGSGGNIAYSVINLNSEITDKWFVAGAGHRSNNTDIEVQPSGMTNRSSVTGLSTGELAWHDTDGNTASWSLTNYTLTAGTSSGYRSIVAELVETAVVYGSSSGVRLPNIRGGADQ
jgi:hypothetical protein